MKYFSAIDYFVIRVLLIIFKKTENLSALACRLVKLTSKHPDPIHPKHLISWREHWYLKYVRKSDTVLDIGCHNGQRTLLAAKKCNKIIGFDYDQNMLKLARKEAQRLRIDNVTFIYANAEKKLPFRNGSFNTILFLDVFEHLRNRTLILEEVYRVLKPQGVLLLSIPNVDTRWKRLQKKYNIFHYSDPDHKIEFTKSEILKILATNKYQVKKILPVTLDTPLVGFIDLLGGISLSLYKAVSTWRRKMALQYPSESIGFEIVCIKN